jgi:monofunctional biosynthetic peptidoglycan transglycosylase
LVAIGVLPIPVILAYRFLPPPVTPLMLIRMAEGEPLRRAWLPLERMSPLLIRAVVASEDARFCHHHGFDWIALEETWRAWRRGHRLRGASTISMQTAKNLFLWPGRSYLRKAAEAYLTALLELLWDKRRILEVYLNVIEWGHGVYGAEAAASAHLSKPVGTLTAREAALMAAVLPDPRQWRPEQPSPAVRRRAAIILERMPDVQTPIDAGCR